jgi:hypothetical protein
MAEANAVSKFFSFIWHIFQNKPEKKDYFQCNKSVYLLSEISGSHSENVSQMQDRRQQTHLKRQ